MCLISPYMTVCLISPYMKVCLMTVCLMTVCLISPYMTVCLMTVCLMTVCLISLYMTVCLMTVCLISLYIKVCLMTVCLMTMCLISLLQDAVRRLKPVNEATVFISSRTDTGVHALCNSAHVDIQRREGKDPFKEEELVHALNHHLRPEEIR